NGAGRAQGALIRRYLDFGFGRSRFARLAQWRRARAGRTISTLSRLWLRSESVCPLSSMAPGAQDALFRRYLDFGFGRSRFARLAQWRRARAGRAISTLSRLWLLS